jgi:hypothetical protein
LVALGLNGVGSHVLEKATAHARNLRPILDASVNACPVGQEVLVRQNLVLTTATAMVCVLMASVFAAMGGQGCLAISKVSQHVSSLEFRFHFSDSNVFAALCVDSCNHRGSCVDGVCVCRSHFAGPSCEIDGCENSTTDSRRIVNVVTNVGKSGDQTM